jgi:excisionase family DNA binding protein
MRFDCSAARQTLDVKGAAQRLGLSEITFRRMIAKREIAHTRIGSGRGVIVFTEDDIQDYLRRRHVAIAA